MIRAARVAAEPHRRHSRRAKPVLSAADQPSRLRRLGLVDVLAARRHVPGARVLLAYRRIFCLWGENRPVRGQPRDTYRGDLAIAGEVSELHGHLFGSVFGENGTRGGRPAESTPAGGGQPRSAGWSSLKWQSVSSIDERLRDSESDLLYAIWRKADGAAVWPHVLLEQRVESGAVAADVQHSHLGARNTPLRGGTDSTMATVRADARKRVGIPTG